MKQIVAALAIDESDKFVIEKAEELKARTGANVVYIHAAETPIFKFLNATDKTGDEAKIKSELINIIQKTALVEDSNVIVSFKSAWELILKTTQYFDADLVILGNMSKNKSVLYLGSTAKKVLEKIGIPVLIARSKPLDKKILIPTDLGAYTMDANYIKNFLKSDNQTEATYVYANTVSFGITVPYTTLAVHSLEFVQEEVEKSIQEFKDLRKDAPTVTLEIEDNISQTIKEYAEKNDYTLTVLASRNLAGLSPIIFGSTASKIAQTLDTNLLITFVNEDSK